MIIVVDSNEVNQIIEHTKSYINSLAPIICMGIIIGFLVIGLLLLKDRFYG